MSDTLSLLFYLSVFVLSTALFWYGIRRQNKRRGRIAIGIAVLAPVVLASMRYMVGTDYVTYLSLFSQFSHLSFADYFLDMRGMELGFFLLIRLSEMLSGNSIVMFAGASLLSVGFFHLGLRQYKVKKPALVYWLYLCVVFPVTLNVVRQGVAISLCFYAFSFILSGNFKKYIFWVLVASLFHISALIMAPIYFVGRYSITRGSNAYIKELLRIAVIAGVTLLALPAITSLIMSFSAFEKYNLYQTILGEGANYTIFLQIAILVFGIISARWAVDKGNLRLYMMLLMFTSLEVALSTIGFTSTFIKRIGLYLSIFSLMLLTESSSMFKDRLGKYVSSGVVILYGFAYFYIAYYALGHADVLPYKIIEGGL